MSKEETGRPGQGRVLEGEPGGGIVRKSDLGLFGFSRIVAAVALVALPLTGLFTWANNLIITDVLRRYDEQIKTYLRSEYVRKEIDDMKMGAFDRRVSIVEERQQQVLKRLDEIERQHAIEADLKRKARRQGDE